MNARPLDRTAIEATRRERIGLLTPSGWGNLGDAAIQDAVIQAIGRKAPGAEICVFSLNPADARQRHRIEADRLSGFSVHPGYILAENGSSPEDGGEGPDASAEATGPRASKSPLTREATSPARALLRRLGPRAVTLLRRAYYDQSYLRRIHRKLADFDLIWVSGGGQLDDEWGGAWGHPWTLAKWSLLCRTRGIPFRVLSVGLCHLDSPFSRLFARMALRQADYVRFRDRNSQLRALQLHLVERAGVTPDLAFAYDGLDPARWVRGEEGVVAVSPMAWCDPRVWPRRDGPAHRKYLAKLRAFVEELLERGHRVLLVSSDGPDVRAVDAIATEIRTEHPHWSSRLETPATGTVEDFLAATRRAEYVVASRLHGFLLACGLGKPALPLSYDPKVDSLASELELEPFLLDIAGFEVAELTQTFYKLVDCAEACRATLARTVAAYRGQLERLFEEALR
jgi:polysaccharide pyruvyl transferase WcaK-like protein